MALCEQGYLCDVCGGDVEEITHSDLYLRYVLGEVAPEKLHVLRERKLVGGLHQVEQMVGHGSALGLHLPVAVLARSP